MSKGSTPVWGWALYDWANSAFATLVMAAFFPVVFKEYWNSGADVLTSTGRLATVNVAASIVMVVLAPLLGALADQGSLRKRFLMWFTYLGVVSTAALFLVGEGNWQVAAALYLLSLLGYSGGTVFYDSLLPVVADREQLDRVSGLGFGLGYLGGGILLALTGWFAARPEVLGLADSNAVLRASFVVVAVWWASFSALTFLWVEEPGGGATAGGVSGWLLQSLRQLVATARQLRNLRPALYFLLAYWFYIDGIDTIIRMAVDYGLSLGFEAGDLMLALLLTQLLGFPAAIIYSRLGARWGVRRALFLGMGVYVAITIWGSQIQHRWEFFVLAVGIGCFQGGIQALSRSYFARLIPEGRSAQFFGFYNIMGRLATIAGPLIWHATARIAEAGLTAGAVEASSLEIQRSATRWGLASLIVLFVAGAWCLSRVPEEEDWTDS